VFKDRIDAGLQLCDRLSHLKGKNALILSIARGGVIVGKVIASCIDGELDVVVPRKLGAPSNPELAIGAVMHDDTNYLNNNIISILNVGEDYINSIIKKRSSESRAMLLRYRGNDEYKIKDRHVVIVDDGIATGATVIVSIAWCRRYEPASITLAVPVMPAEMYERLKITVDELVVLLTPYDFGAVGEFYDNFDPVSDEEVMDALKSKSKSKSKNENENK
jgi:predicted phosphoribosyltransferase